MAIPQSKKYDDEALERLADELQSEREMAEATLDGLDARIDAAISDLEQSDIDDKFSQADKDVAAMAEETMRADVEDLQDLNSIVAEAQEEQDRLLEEDELDPATAGAGLTPEDTGLDES